MTDFGGCGELLFVNKAVNRLLAVSGGAKVEENRRIENPVVAARKAGFRNAGFTG